MRRVNSSLQFSPPLIISGASCDITLEQILSFSTGAVVVPPAGFQGCALSFSSSNPYPTSSTCTMELTLPLKYDLFDEFKEACRIAFSCHGGFGLI